MDVQVIWKEGKPDYAVLPWAEFQQLMRDAGRPLPGAKEEAPAAIASESVARLTELREQQSMTLESLAREAGISPAYLQLIESGERQASDVLLRALGRALGVTLSSEGQGA